MLMKVKVENGFITNVNGKDIIPSRNLDIHTWNIKIEDRIIRCKSFSRAIPEKKSVTRFSLKDSTIYLVNKINDAYCYQRSSVVENFLESNNINVVKCMETEGITIDDDMFSQLEDRYVRYDKRIFISPTNRWAIVGDMDSDFNILYVAKESDFKKFFRDENFLKELVDEFHMVNWNNWNIPEEFAIRAIPANNGFYRCKSNRNFIVSYFQGDGLLPDNFDYAVFNGIGKDYYNEQLNNLNIRVSEYRDFYFDPPTGESIQLIYAIDSRYWEKL
jgi:hypothetical protein